MGQPLIQISDIVGGENIVQKNQLNESLVQAGIKSAAYEPSSAFMPSNTCIPNVPELTLVRIERDKAVWYNGWLHVNTGNKLSNGTIGTNSIIALEVYVHTGTGSIKLSPVVSYPSARTKHINSIPLGFYLTDENQILNQYTDYDFIDVYYALAIIQRPNYDGVLFDIGTNVVNEDNNVSHSDALKSIFFDIYPSYDKDFVQTYNDPLTDFGNVFSYYTPTYAQIKKANLFMRPYVGASISENISSNPNILTVASHYGNMFQRFDITNSATDFLSNVIAISSGPDTENPTEGCSYGFGVEFFEDPARTQIDYPDYNPASWSPYYQQSSTTAIVAAKLRLIQDLTGLPWGLCRLAARMTAKKTVGGLYASGHAWDMYRGFGMINVNDAVSWINTNLNTLEYRQLLADKLEGLRRIHPFLEYEDILDNSPIAKRHLKSVINGGLREYSGNAYAKAAGLKVGELYRTGEVLKIVY